MTEEEQQKGLAEALATFLKEVERLKGEHETGIRGILKEIDEMKIKDVRKRLGLN